MKASKISFILSFLLLLTITACKQKTIELTEWKSKDYCTAWAKMTLHIFRNTPANSPTYASRCLGYIGVTMYESMVGSDSSYQSLSGQISELQHSIVSPTGVDYDWLMVMNAGQAQILRSLYTQTADSNFVKIDSLENLIAERRVQSGVDKHVLKASKAHGQAIAAAIFEWSKTDKGHRGFLKNFDKKMVNPSFAGSWKPPHYGQSFSRFPLHPHWGDNRTFCVDNSKIPLPNFIPFDTAVGSAYYNQFLEVYNKRKTLTDDEKRASVWWGDDPDESFTPPGHSWFLATIAIGQSDIEAIEAAKIYAQLGMALADAFINCWKWKFHFFSERPNTYINEHMDDRWESFWPDPPFPAFPSGHAIQAAAAATILSFNLGDSLHIVDNTHEGRPPDKLRKLPFPVRTYESFWEIALETANSRFYGGIHTPQDNLIGLENGKIIAQNILKLKWNEQ